MTPADSLRVAVYGTLKRHGRLHSAMDGATFLGEDVFPGLLFTWGQVPAAIPPEKGEKVHCEVYECPERVVRQLDFIEAHPWVYERQLVSTEKFGQVWAYIYQRKLTGARRLESGKFDALHR